jgi:two-component system, NtrC family, sensor kinase
MKRGLLISILFYFGLTQISAARADVVLLRADQFQSHQRLFLAPLEAWEFRAGPEDPWSYPEIKDQPWIKMNPLALSPDLEDTNDRIEGWFLIKFKLDPSLQNIPLGISRNLWAATDVYLDGELIHSFGDTGKPYEAFNPILKYPIPIDLKIGKEYLLAIHFVDYESLFTQREIRLSPNNLKDFINLTGPDYVDWVTQQHKLTHLYTTLCISVSFLLFFLYWFLAYLNPDQKIFRIIGGFTTVVLLGTLLTFGNTFFEISYSLEKVRFVLFVTCQAIMVLFALFILEWVLTAKISRLSWIILSILLLVNILAHIFSISLPFGLVFLAMLLHFARIMRSHLHLIKGAKMALIAGTVVPTLATLVYIMLHKYDLDLYNEYDKLLLSLTILSPPLFLLAYISVRFKETLVAQKIEAEKVLKVSEEKKTILATQKEQLEILVKKRTEELSKSLENLKSTQAQLIQSEKMASLGELTAGIAHEIQNPLNFVNNFSELNKELVEEANGELEKGDIEETKAILKDLRENSEKINLHGKRAGAIVKGMLEHSRKSEGKKEPVNLNLLADECLKLGFHGLRAKDKTFSADFKALFAEDLPEVSVVRQDIGRVLLNLINNAFYAVHNFGKTQDKEFQPTVTVCTSRVGNQVVISVSDNGKGIPEQILDKIFQPFFTTKPTGEGTGLGLSLSYDIIKAHGGELVVKSKVGEGAIFTITLPIS